MTELRDRLLAVPDDFDPRKLPPDFGTAREALRRAIAQTEQAGVCGETLVMAMMSETLPRLVDCHGPLAAAKILECMSAAIAGGMAPSGRTQ
jgi:hypothetical protein